MRARLFAFTLCLSSLTVAVANCGSEGSEFGSGGSGDGGADGGPFGNQVGFGDPNKEGGTGVGSDDCKRLTCADLGANCGPQGDGCGGKIESCGDCTGAETCGGGGTPSVCGGTQGCVPRTCDDIGVECGPAGDGCGGTLQCGSCTAPAFCGGGGPSKCGGGQVSQDGGVVLPDGGTCTRRTTADCVANECGPVADGCGGIINCPGCPTGTTCGGGGSPSRCGAPSCQRTTCPLQNADCGFVADGCGGILRCGPAAPAAADSCPTSGHICGGGGPNKCGAGNVDGGSGSCTNLCLDIPTDCGSGPGGNSTAITGTVYMPNGTLPVADALVYVPNGTPSAVPTGVQATCTACEGEATGAPLISTRTDALGRFTLPGMPWRAGGVPVVIQKGRWRKQITVTQTRCQSLELSPTWPQTPTANNTTFGATQSATNNIPKFAVTTGDFDSLQCLLRKVGIADSEFTRPGTTSPNNGRVNIYAGIGGSTRTRSNFNASHSGTGSNRNFENETVLFGDGDPNVVDSARLRGYDGVLLSCTGGENSVGDRISNYAGYRAEMKDYADRGGHIFASHWHHSWLEHGPAPWNTSGGVGGGKLATVQHQNDLVKPLTVNINTAPTFPKGGQLADWLRETHRLAGTLAQASPRGQLVLGTEGHDDGAQHTINAVDPTRVNTWISVDTPPQCSGQLSCTPAQSVGNSPNNSIQYFDFNTPVDAATQCGRFVISDLHVATADDNDSPFPDNCGADMSMTDQEKVLAFMLFDLTSCITPIVPETPTCSPRTCGDLGISCGPAGNGCGGQLACGVCPEGQVCQGGSCRTPQCDPLECADVGANCGIISNGCGGTRNCGPCPEGQVCGGSGPNRCGANTCTPTTCQAQGIQCGPAGNGCGQALDCGPCPLDQTCGGGGVPGVCGAPNCTKKTCQELDANCGFIADGCGGLLDCGVCQNGQTCGGTGVANKCGGGGVN